jgi:hypothetical protein
MKTYLLSSFLLAAFLFFTGFRPQTSPLDEVVNALKSGNVSQLSRYFDNTVEIALPEKSDSYSKTQAEIVLKDFFNSRGVKNFDLEHRGDNSGSQYCIGTLQTRTGNFRAVIFMKQRSNQQWLQELRIEAKR